MRSGSDWTVPVQPHVVPRGQVLPLTPGAHQQLILKGIRFSKMLSFRSKTQGLELRFSHNPTFFTIDTSKAISCWDNERCQVCLYNRLALLLTLPHSEWHSALQHAMCLSTRQSFLPSWRIQGLQTPGRCVSCWAAFLGSWDTAGVLFPSAWHFSDS